MTGLIMACQLTMNKNKKMRSYDSGRYITCSIPQFQELSTLRSSSIFDIVEIGFF